MGQEKNYDFRYVLELCEDITDDTKTITGFGGALANFKLGDNTGDDDEMELQLNDVLAGKNVTLIVRKDEGYLKEDQDAEEYILISVTERKKWEISR